MRYTIWMRHQLKSDYDDKGRLYPGRQGKWEPVPGGDFATLQEAEAALNGLATNLGWNREIMEIRRQE